jgi:hypothetical protein
MSKTVKLYEIAKTIRSKNAGIHFLTFDIIFENKEHYEMVKNSRMINKKMISKIYKVPEEKVVGFYEYDPGLAIKATIDRPLVSADVGDPDIYGCQQYAPLMDIDIKLKP